MTGFIVSVFPFRNRVSSKEAFEGLELGEGKPSRPVLRGPGGRKAAWLLGSNGQGPGKRCQLNRRSAIARKADVQGSCYGSSSLLPSRGIRDFRDSLRRNLLTDRGIGCLRIAPGRALADRTPQAQLARKCQISGLTR
jgi:hypothetical protein